MINTIHVVTERTHFRCGRFVESVGMLLCVDCPDAIFVRSIPGRAAHLDPKRIPAQDRDIHLVELKLCPDINPLPSLRTSADQHAGTISRLRTRCPRNPKQK
eukprot:934205-Pelagomonas_calceolata.AAC.1